VIPVDAVAKTEQKGGSNEPCGDSGAGFHALRVTGVEAADEGGRYG
jgi:hypothetical protein